MNYLAGRGKAWEELYSPAKLLVIVSLVGNFYRVPPKSPRPTKAEGFFYRTTILCFASLLPNTLVLFAEHNSFGKASAAMLRIMITAQEINQSHFRVCEILRLIITVNTCICY